MKRFYVALVLLLLAIPLWVSAQATCQNLPCGPIPWPLPGMPVLVSPSPMPTLNVNITAVPTGAATATPVPLIPTNPPIDLDTDGINNQLATLQSVMESTSMVIQDINGTPVDTNATFTELGDNAGTFFGYARGLSDLSFGKLSPLIAFALLALVTVLSVKSFGFFLPIIAAVWGFIRKIVQIVLEFIPL